MATTKLGLTRDQFAAFLQDHEQIKQFENLFATVDSEVGTASVTEANTLAQNAYAIGNEALAGIVALNDLVAPLVTAPPPTGGTVTSVAASGGTTGLTFSGSPITTSGTITMAGTLGVANGGTGVNSLTAGYLVKGNGTSAVSASIVYDDGTNLGIGTAFPGAKLDVVGNIRLSAANPAIELNNGGPQVYVPGVANTLAFATGGGIGSAIERFRIGSAGQWGIGGANYGTSGQVLTSQGASAAPIWATPAAGTVTSVSGTGSVNGITLSGTVTSSGSLTLGGTLSGVDLTSQVTGTLPVANGGTGTATAFTAGSVVFAGASGVYSQDNANFFWDDTNNRLGIGNTGPGYAVDISSSDTTANLGYALRLRSNATAAASAIQFTNSGVTAQNGIVAVTDTGEMKLQADGASSAIVFYLFAGTERFRIGAAGQIGLSGTNYGTSGQVLSSQGSGSPATWLSLATVATSGSFSDLSNKPGVRSNGQNVITGSKTLGSADSGTNILIVASGITITFPSTGFASGEGFAISNVSGGNVTLSCPGGSDFGTTLPNGGTFFAFSDGGGYWRQYCYSTSRL